MIIKKTCKECDIAFEAKTKRATYCSIKCKDSYFYKLNKEEHNLKTREYYNNNKEKVAINKSNYLSNNKDKIKEYNRQFKIKNRKYFNAKEANHRAAKLNATIGEYKEEILTIYNNCPDNYHVDHIVPLKGKLVSGLHVPWNLQYLTPEENLRKGNRL